MELEHKVWNNLFIHECHSYPFDGTVAFVLINLSTGKPEGEIRLEPIGIANGYMDLDIERSVFKLRLMDMPTSTRDQLLMRIFDFDNRLTTDPKWNVEYDEARQIIKRVGLREVYLPPVKNSDEVSDS